MKKFIEDGSRESTLFFKYVDYVPTSIHFKVFTYDTIAVGSIDEAMTIEKIIDNLEPLMTSHAERLGFTGSPIKKIIRESLEAITNWNSGVFLVNPNKVPLEQYAERLVERHVTKYNEAYNICKSILADIQVEKITHDNWRLLGDYNNNIQYYEFTDFPVEDDLKALLGPSPTDKFSKALDDALELLKKHNLNNETIS